eukprot:gene2536-3498_t
MSEELTVQQKKEFQEAFNLFDQNGDGDISVEELKIVFSNIGHEPTDEELENMLNEVDKDGNGKIDFDEFCQIMKSKMSTEDPRTILQKYFNDFDKNKDGFLTSEELKAVMKTIGEELTDDEVDAMIQYADKDGDGKVGIEDFFSVMSSISN